MNLIQPLSDFPQVPEVNSPVSDWYEGRCPTTGEWLRLPRNQIAEAIAHAFMQSLSSDDRFSQEGKMYGVLLIEQPSGEQGVLKAFSGLLNRESTVPGWVPPIPGRQEVAQRETETLAQLETMKQELIMLQQMPEREEYKRLSQEFDEKLREMGDRHRQRKQERQRKREQLQETLRGDDFLNELEKLEEESRRDGIERRNLKRQRDQRLTPLKTTVDASDRRILDLRQQRKQISRQLQEEMHHAYRVTNFWGQSLSVGQVLTVGAMPTGTGDCCAPKLLHYAATHRLKPLAMAEFWWGPALGDRQPGQFYGACAERCQPLMGFLLSGLSQFREIDLIYEDTWIIAANKPAGLLSVPGRRSDRQDSLLTRLRDRFPHDPLLPVHRLDQDTSGILLFARDLETYRHLTRQFQERQVYKCYEAILTGKVLQDEGVIDLPLWGDPGDRPYQKVNPSLGKPSVTKFRVLSREATQTRVEFFPLTGRTHQIRVHAAEGLGVPIMGDRLYGKGGRGDRLCLHAKELDFEHPQTGGAIVLAVETPF